MKILGKYDIKIHGQSFSKIWNFFYKIPPRPFSCVDEENLCSQMFQEYKTCYINAKNGNSSELRCAKILTM